MAREPRITAETLKLLGALMARPSDELSGADIAATTQLSSGTMYPILLRFERAGWLQSRWEAEDPSVLRRPRRRYYQLTAEGVRRVRSVVRELEPTFGRLAWS